MVTGHPVSATEIAGVTGLAHAAASYHLRRLATAGLLQAVPLGDREPRRGRPQQRYRMREEPFRGIGRRGVRLLDRGLLTELARRLGEAGARRRVTDAEAWLAPKQWRELRRLLDQVDEIVHRRSQPPRAGDSKHVSVTTLLFEHQR